MHVPMPQFCPMQAMAWKAVGSLMHWKPQVRGEPPPWTQVTKHVTSSMQPGAPRQLWSWAQQLWAMQSPQAEPSLGHSERPHTPKTHAPEQQSSGAPHGVPSAEHWVVHWPARHWLLQHSSKLMQGAPSGSHATTQVPPSQVPVQQSGPIMQAEPVGLQTPQFTPQSSSAWATHALSQLLEQHEGCAPHTVSVHELQPGARASPAWQMPCGHSGEVAHTPFSQTPVQHSSGVLQSAPMGVHMPQPQLCVASWTHRSSQPLSQQKGSKSQIVPAQSLQAGLSGAPISHSPCSHTAIPQKPPSQTPVQHWGSMLQGEPSG